MVHLPIENIISGKLEALFNRKKPRDFYDYYFLLVGNYPLIKESKNLKKVQEMLQDSEINFRAELKKMLPASHQFVLKDFKKNLTQEIKKYL